MSHAVQIQRLESTPLAVVRRRTISSELSRIVPECCGLVWNAVRAQHAAAGRHVALYWEGPDRIEVGVELHGPFAERDHVVLSATPAGTVAATTHFAPYRGLGAAHDAIRHWCRATSHVLAGPYWEIYGPWQPEWEADVSRIRSDVFYLLAPVESSAQSL